MTDSKRSFMGALIIFLKGVFMGGADIIPGVSGGTIALITGIYERLVLAIRSIDPRVVPLFLKGLIRRESMEEAR
ncbi:MAG: undecaprenyl phosphate translocase family protein, partial [Methanomassiliicoccales archaeon]